MALKLEPGTRLVVATHNLVTDVVSMSFWATPATVLAKMKPILDRYVDLSPFTNIKIAGSRVLEPRLTPFQTVHLTTDQFGGMNAPGSWTRVNFAGSRLRSA